MGNEKRKIYKVECIKMIPDKPDHKIGDTWNTDALTQDQVKTLRARGFIKFLHPIWDKK